MNLNSFKSLFNWGGAKSTAPDEAVISDIPDYFREFNATREVPEGTSPCLAPWTSLGFNIDGTASICCLNKKVSVNIEGKTIDEVWNSPDFKELRASVADHNLNHDCEICLHQIQAKNFYGVKARDYDKFHGADSDYPQVMEFCLENTCNLACEMCSAVFSSTIRKNHGLPPQKKFYGEDFVKDLDKYIPHLKEAIFAGGEPFLTPLYFKIWERMIELNPTMTIGIVTNATTLNDRIKNLLERGRFRINTSIDSFDKETYEEIRKGSDYETVIENFDWFRAYGERKGLILNVPVCPLTTNWKTIPDLVRFANDKKVAVNFVHVERPVTLALVHQSAEYLQEVVDFFSAQNFEAEGDMAKRNVSKFSGLLETVRVWRDNNASVVVTDAPKSVIALDSWEEKVLNSDELADDEQKQELIISVKSALDTLPEENQAEFIKILSAFSVERVHHFVAGKSGKEVAIIFKDFMGR